MIGRTLRPLLKPIGLAIVIALGLSVVAEAQLRPGSFSILRVVTRIVLGSGTQLSDTASGKLLLTGTTPTIQVGGSTSSFPALRRTGANIDFVLADASAFTGITAASATFNGAGVQLSGGGGALILGANLIVNTAPTISSGFGTSPSIVASNGTAAFTVNVGTGGVATSGVIGLPAATTGWNCFVIDRTNNVVTRQTATATTTATLTAASAWSASDILQVSCFAY